MGIFSFQLHSQRFFLLFRYNWKAGLVKLQEPGGDPLNVFLIFSDTLQAADLLPQFFHLVQLLSSCTPLQARRSCALALAGGYTLMLQVSFATGSWHGSLEDSSSVLTWALSLPFSGCSWSPPAPQRDPKNAQIILKKLPRSWRRSAEGLKEEEYWSCSANCCNCLGHLVCSQELWSLE